jgi:predicted nuclease of restriction endonuclease-like (RecB) superfamily
MPDRDVRTLRKKIDSMLYERTALSKKPKKLIDQEPMALRQDDYLTPDLVFRDPYLLDFLGLKDTYAEKDLEAAILREMESFILELGVALHDIPLAKDIIVTTPEDFEWRKEIAGTIDRKSVSKGFRDAFSTSK